MQDNIPKEIMKELLNKYLDIILKKAENSPAAYEKVSLVLWSLPFEEYKNIKKNYINYLTTNLKDSNWDNSSSLSIEILWDVKDSFEWTILKAALLEFNGDIWAWYYYML